MNISEQFRIAAKDWVDKDGAANMLEESKSAVLARLIVDQGDMPVSHAERNVKAGKDWQDYIEKMVNARTAASLAKVKCEYIRMLHSEKQSAEANARAEKRL